MSFDDVRSPDDPIEELNLSIRAYNCLLRTGLLRVRDLLTATDVKLLAIRNFSERCLFEVRARLIEYGYREPGDR